MFNLILQGKYSGKKLSNRKDLFLIDYSEQDVPVGTIHNDIRLVEVIDKLGNNLEYIPKGYCVLGKFEFLDGIPNEINNLIESDEFFYNEKRVKI